ncbi:MAG: hypothetical protein ACREPQ_14715 [Rhodanobacter sp.]
MSRSEAKRSLNLAQGEIRTLVPLISDYNRRVERWASTTFFVVCLCALGVVGPHQEWVLYAFVGALGSVSGVVSVWLNAVQWRRRRRLRYFRHKASEAGEVLAARDVHGKGR